ncbi:Winged helix-turn-helix transcriptional regulator [uncultured Gammaproteobacteria bacterium]
MSESIALGDRDLTEEQEPSMSNRETYIFLGLLAAIERNSAVSQRDLSRELGIAVGWVNTYLKRCVRKGLVKMTQVPLNRYSYYLTPSGFNEKGRLTVEYLRSSFDFFRTARQQCRDIFTQCGLNRISRIALVGCGDLSEIAVLSAGECGFRIVAVIDAAVSGTLCCGVPVVEGFGPQAPLTGTEAIQSLVITDLMTPQQTFERIVAQAAAAGLVEGQILVPPLLNVTRGPGLVAFRSGEADHA